ncbi:outer membrane protein assembly factor BamB family protein [Halorussus ruber]|uniref:outer membrane protein assembly factor BamB family protein n=1 Tax=Halorussus ruber TaxID=1126238 RepID=UPI001B2FEFFE|nr:PQQ-binding-like beta-propeller repeat protein [Halorussus ruber]
MQRRTALTTIGGVTTSVVAGCLTPMRGDSDDQNAKSSTDDNIGAGIWPQVAHDAQNTSHTPDTRGPRDGASIAWTSLGDRPVYPPVVDDALYFTEAWTDGTAFALASTDGTEQWSNTELPPMRWAPALYEDLLLVITRQQGNVVRLHALDTATGNQAWVREDGITASSGERPPIGPTVADRSVYLGSNRGIIACEAATGAIEWTATLGKHVVDTEDGPTWRTDWATPAVTAERAFTFDMNDSYQQTREVYAVNRSTGDREWTRELTVGDGWFLKGHVVAGADYVFVSALKPHVSVGFDDSEWSGTEKLFALEAESGAVVWEWELPRKTLTPPAYADGTLYVGEWYPDADTGRLHALVASDGSHRWTYRTNTGAVRSPTVAGDTVYINQGKELAAVATADGTRRWQLEVGARTGSLVIIGDTAYVQTNPGHNYDSQLLAIRES